MIFAHLTVTQCTHHTGSSTGTAAFWSSLHDGLKARFGEQAAQPHTAVSLRQFALERTGQRQILRYTLDSCAIRLTTSCEQALLQRSAAAAFEQACFTFSPVDIDSLGVSISYSRFAPLLLLWR